MMGILFIHSYGLSEPELDLQSRFLSFGNLNKLTFRSLNRNLVYTLLVATTLELGGEVLIHDLAGHVLIDEAARHHQHVSIIVLADEMGNLRNPAETGSDRLMLVERHVDTFARSADGYARENFAILNTTGQCMAEVAIVAGVLGIGAVVLKRVALLLEVLLHELLKCIASVVAGYAYCLDFHYARSFLTCS